jgi:hypothetical protein
MYRIPKFLGFFEGNRILGDKYRCCFHKLTKILNRGKWGRMKQAAKWNNRFIWWNMFWNMFHSKIKRLFHFAPCFIRPHFPLLSRCLCWFRCIKNTWTKIKSQIFKSIHWKMTLSFHHILDLWIKFLIVIQVFFKLTLLLQNDYWIRRHKQLKQYTLLSNITPFFNWNEQCSFVFYEFEWSQILIDTRWVVLLKMFRIESNHQFAWK